MSTRHQCETSTWRHEAHFAVLSSRQRLMRLPQLLIPTTFEVVAADTVAGRHVLAAASTVVTQLQGLRTSADRMCDRTQKL